MNRFTISCTAEQTKKALDLGAPIKTSRNRFDEDVSPIYQEGEEWLYAVIPTAEQMIGWLKTKGMKFYFNDITSLYQIVADTKIIAQGCYVSKELAAIDAALEYLKSKN